MELRWGPLDRHSPDILCLWLGSDEVARVARRVDGAGWHSQVARHRPDWRDRLSTIAPSELTAMRWAERWTRANLARILVETPPLHRTHCGTLSVAAPEPLVVS